MNDTVTKILDLVGEYAEHYAEDRRWGTFTADTTKARQALQDELTRLFTPLTDEQINPLCKETWVVETVKQWVRAIESMHGITGEKNEVA